MTGRHVPSSETGADGPHPEWDDLIDGRRLPETEDEMRVADAVAALQAPGTVDELRGADAAVAALLAAMAAAPAPERESVVVPLAPRRRARTGVIAGSVVAATLVLTGTAAAAATGSLPAPLQRIAESLVGAPAPASDDQDADGATPGSPTGSGSPTTRPASPPARPAPSDRPSAPVGPGAPAPGSSPGAAGTSAGAHPATPTPPGQTGVRRRRRARPCGRPCRRGRPTARRPRPVRATARPRCRRPPATAATRTPDPSRAVTGVRPRVIHLPVPCSGLLRTGDGPREPV